MEDFVRKNGHYIYRTYRTLKDGTRLYAKDFGLKAWRIWVED